MTRTIFAFVALLISLTSYSQNKGHYIIIIDNDSIQVDLDSDFQYKTSSGEELTIRIDNGQVKAFMDLSPVWRAKRECSIS